MARPTVTWLTMVLAMLSLRVEHPVESVRGLGSLRVQHLGASPAMVSMSPPLQFSPGWCKTMQGAVNMCSGTPAEVVGSEVEELYKI